MDDLKPMIKKYWPYVLGGVVGIYLIVKFSSPKAVSQGDGGYSAFLNSQAQAGAMQSQNALQSQALQAQIDADERKSAREFEVFNLQSNRDYELTTKRLELEQTAIHANAMNQFQLSQAAMAQSVSQGAAGVIGELSRPSIHAMNSAASENAAALQAAAMAAAGGYLAQSDMVSSMSGMVGDVSKSLGATNSALAAIAQSPRPPSLADSMVQGASVIARGGPSGGFGGAMW